MRLALLIQAGEVGDVVLSEDGHGLMDAADGGAVFHLIGAGEGPDADFEPGAFGTVLDGAEIDGRQRKHSKEDECLERAEAGDSGKPGEHGLDVLDGVCGWMGCGRRLCLRGLSGGEDGQGFPVGIAAVGIGESGVFRDGVGVVAGALKAAGPDANDDLGASGRDFDRSK